MKAFVIHGKESCSFIETDAPQVVHDDDVLVQVKAMGICGTDLHIYEGAHPMCQGVDRVPGHEFAGVVTAVGKSVKKLKVGDRVVHEPISYCGHCYACRHEQGNVCRDVHVTGCNMDGGCQELFCAAEKQWHKIPDWMTWEQAALVEPYTIAAQCCKQANLMAEDIVLIHGGGPIGLMCCDTAKHMGATVIVSEIMEGRLTLAKELGADYVINPINENLEQRVEEITGGEGVNVIFDCAGLQKLVDANMRMLSPAGRFVPVAPCPIHIEAGGIVMLKQLTIIGSRLQMHQFVPVISRYELYAKHATQMITDVFPFDEADKAFAFAAAKHPQTGKVVIRF